MGIKYLFFGPELKLVGRFSLYFDGFFKSYFPIIQVLSLFI